MLVGAKCLHQIVPRSGASGSTRTATSQQLINLLPDMATKITIRTDVNGGRKKLPPDESTALSTYRNYWKANIEHYDFENEDICDRRFLLVGRPQVGKTGAFLHLVYLLWREYGREVQMTDPEEIQLPADSFGDPPEDVLVSTEEESQNMGLYPNFDYMQGQTFYDKPGAGKYGDPKDPILVQWYLKPTFSKDPHPSASLSSTAGAAKLKQTSIDDGKRSNTNAPETQVGGMSDDEHSTNLLDPLTTETRFSYMACAGNFADNVEYCKFHVCGGTLYVPKSKRDLWWDISLAADIKLKDRSGVNQCVLIPIFVMSRGRARCKRCRGEVCSNLSCHAASVYHNDHSTILLLTTLAAAFVATLNPQRHNRNDTGQRRKLQLWETRSQSRHALQVCFCVGCVCCQDVFVFVHGSRCVCVITESFACSVCLPFSVD